MHALTKSIVGSVAALTLGATAASAAIVCNDEGDCWKVRGHVTYKPELKLHVYGDNWKWHEGEHYRWREAGHGHGYWRQGVWVSID